MRNTGCCQITLKKQLIIKELNNSKNNPETFKSYIKSLLGIGVEASISTLIGNLL